MSEHAENYLNEIGITFACAVMLGEVHPDLAEQVTALAYRAVEAAQSRPASAPSAEVPR